mgnify:CR=1 FL=1
MKLKKTVCFSINSFTQALETISICKQSKIIPILYIRYFLINGFGIDWIKELRIMLLEKFSKNEFRLFIDTRKNYGLFISLVEEKIDYIKVNASIHNLKKLRQISNLNKVLINPNISVVDLFRTQNISKKIKRIIQEINEN